ncbi:hypothetical protein ACP70R_004168 [Stipagrostis hirtigluma subsp. patula]
MAAGTSATGGAPMDKRLLEAASAGDARLMKQMASDDPAVLLGTTPQGNTCLHISSIHGHKEFCRGVLELNKSLLATVNADDETPLLTAVISGRVSLAFFLLSYCRDQQLSKAILQQDKRGFNALHHAIRSGQRDLALKLIEEEPELSRAVNKYDESPMYMAAMKGYADVAEKLLAIPHSSDKGPYGQNAMHAAVRSGNRAIVKSIMETRCGLAREEDNNTSAPIKFAVFWGKTDALRVILEHDCSLGYHISSKGLPLLELAAYRGQIDTARELLKHCPDAPYGRSDGWTCLHTAIRWDQMQFMEFVLGTHQLVRKVINVRDKDGDTPLHIAVSRCQPNMVAALLRHQDIDVTIINNGGSSAVWKLNGINAAEHAKTLNWNEVFMLMLKADPEGTAHIYNLHKQMKDKVTDKSRKDIKSLTKTYTSNTSLVAILIATITFAAAFTLPGGYSSDAGSEGLPIMARKLAFQAFMVFDTLAMCSSLVIAFVCIIARWEDLEFLLYYRSFTKKLMWFAYMATTMAFATGLYTVLAPRLLWLAIVVCILSVLLPILTKLVGEWPVLMLRFRLGRTFKPELLDMV